MTEREIFKFTCENDLAFYAKHAFKVLEPDQVYQHNWHIDVVSEHLEAITKRLIRNLNINIPPRTIKSVLVNVIYPTWLWTFEPTAKVISCSHSASLSNAFNIRRNDLIKSDWYQSFWPTEIKKGVDTQRKFENTRGGAMLAVSVGGALTGEEADYLIGDDLLNAEDAKSEAKREYANEWYSSTMYNRLRDKKTGVRINVMQRLHQKDLTGHLNKKYKFTQLVIPMQYKGKQVENALGWKDPRTEIGEYMHPVRYAQAEKDDEYGGLGEYGWAGQMQQEPAPAGGGVIKKNWIRVENCSHLFNNTDKIISIDATFKDSKKSDYVTIGVWTRSGPDFALLNAIRGKWAFPKTLEMTVLQYKKFNPTKLLIEDKANGPAIISVLKKHIPGIKPINPKDSKEARLQSVAPLFECQNVILHSGLELLPEIKEELLLFPNAEYDDLVDMITQALSEMRDDTSELVFA